MKKQTGLATERIPKLGIQLKYPKPQGK